MQPLKPRKGRQSGPEAAIQEKIIAALRAADWAVIVTHGNEFQMGLPDLYCAHLVYGARWIEVKNPEAFSFTKAQREIFPLLTSKGVGIWVLGSAEPHELQKIHGSPNWWHYLDAAKI